MQWVADGHVAVICHDCQEKAVSATKGDKKDHLYPTASQQNALLGPQRVGGHQRHQSGGVADLYKGQVGQEEIHWGAQRAACAHHPDDGCVATEDHQVEEKEEAGEGSLEFRDRGEHVEHKLGGARLVEDEAPSQHVSCQRAESTKPSFAELLYCLNKNRDF